MRVTQSMLSNSFLNNLNSSYEKFGKLQDQLTSQKKINRPSDDPVVAMSGIAYRTDLQQVEQYKRNFSEAYNWTDNSDSALDQATQALQRIRELTLEASNGTQGPDEREAAAKEIAELRDHLAKIGNTKVGNKYIFNGTDTLNKPIGDVTKTPPEVSTNHKDVNIELSQGINIKVNVDGSKVFSQDLFSQINSLIDKLNSGVDNVKYDDDLTNLDKNLNTILGERSSLGARSNRIELMESRIDQQQISATKMVSDNEDVDMDKVITDFTTQQSVFRAALGAGAQIIQPTLLDFLR
ncbi:flagellar hook-associated protein FlgL [Bacillus sp. APMAM]|nr:flagellar hook-associated protein FlgL [Bacillus sp. APMAM]RTZ55028.1 flagellar hook-associated protein FlgL [Bacillus sp. SAJ1]